SLRVGDTRPIGRGSLSGRAILDGQTHHVPDLLETDLATEFPDIQSAVEREGVRTCLATPLIWEGRPIGALTIYRTEALPFATKQIELVRTFADQAVIAIENVRLLNETKEALKKQTAISEILRVTSASPTDVQPVFNTIVRNAVTLCGSTNGAVFRYDG